MITSEYVKKAGKQLGAALVGISSMDRFEGAPKQQDPRYIFPDAKACIVLGFRIPRGYFRGIEEGTYFATYPAMGYGGLNQIYMPIVLRELTCFIEDRGFEAVPVPNMYPGTAINFATQKHNPNRSVPVSEDKPNPDVLMDFRIAAFAAGLGEFGYSKMFLTPEFGPRVRFVAILTDAPLEADPIFNGKICDRCLKCVGACSGKAISPKETESIIVAGCKVEWGKLDVTKCSVAYRGGNSEYNPFIKPDADFKEYSQKYCGRPDLDKVVGYPKLYETNASLEGARGCIRACMIHLEERGVLKNRFENPFRTKKPWRLSRDIFLNRKGNQEEMSVGE